jgi:hypothetical protein
MCNAAKQTTSASRLRVIEKPEVMPSDQKEMNEDFLIHTVPFIVMVNTHSPAPEYPVNLSVNDLIFELHIKCLATP